MYIHVCIYIYIYTHTHDNIELARRGGRRLRSISDHTQHDLSLGHDRCDVHVDVHDTCDRNMISLSRTRTCSQSHKVCDVWSGGTKRAASVYMPLLLLQSSVGNFTTSDGTKPVRRSLRRRRSCSFTEVARLVPSGVINNIYIYIEREREIDR